jgi:hypothetical protein
MIVDTSEYAHQARARLWNLMLGGSEAYEDDRWLLNSLKAAVPHIARLAANEREFVDRFWRFVASIGIGQVVHIGAPLPSGHPPHKMLPAPGRVVYVERDELLARKGEAWMAEPGVDVVHADPLDVPAMVDAIGGKVEWFEPIAVIAPGVLSWVGEAEARTWVKLLVEELPARSMVATTHLLDPQLPETAGPIERLLCQLDTSQVGVAFFRRRAAIAGLFPDLTLDAPGVQLAVDWFPNGPRLRDASLVDQLLAAAVLTVPASP